MTEYYLVIVGIALFVSFVRAIQGRGTDSLFKTIWKYLSYYTILSNILVFIWLFVPTFWPDSAAGMFFKNANTSAAITFYIFTVGLANYLIFGWQDLSMADRISDLLVHAVTPLLTMLYWFILVDKTGLDLGLIGYWLIYPLAYALYTILHGPLTGFYPYEFTNAKELGIKKVLLSTLLLSVALMIGGSLFITMGQMV